MSQFYSKEREKPGFDSPFLGESTAQSFHKSVEPNTASETLPGLEEQTVKESLGTETPLALISKSSYDNLHASD